MRAAATVLLVCGLAASAPAEAAFPLRGELAGELKIAALEEPGLAWRLEAGPDGMRLRALRPGLELVVILRPGAEGTWAWRIERGAIDLAELWPSLRAKLGPQAATWSASGRVELAGEGKWSAAAGPEGELRLTLREGWARSDELEAELDGVELDLVTRDLGGGTLPAGQRFRIKSLRTSGIAFADLAGEFGLEAGGVVALSRMEAGVLGGRLRLRPLRVALAKPEPTVTAELENLSVADLAWLAPDAVAAGEGRLGGRLRASWSPAGGVKILDGGLSVKRGDRAKLRLAPLPGFLTGELPRPLAWLSPRLVADLGRIELGKTPIEVESLEVVFSPDGVDGLRTAQVKVFGRPAGRSSVNSVRFEVNISGDLTRALMLGLSDRVSLEF